MATAIVLGARMSNSAVPSSSATASMNAQGLPQQTRPLGERGRLFGSQVTAAITSTIRRERSCSRAISLSSVIWASKVFEMGKVAIRPFVIGQTLHRLAARATASRRINRAAAE